MRKEPLGWRRCPRQLPTLSMGYNDIARLASSQHGLLAWAQARNAGLSEGEIRSLLRREWLEVVSDGVFRVSGSPPSPEQSLLAAVLGGGSAAVASHRSAAWLWGMSHHPGVDEITVPLDRAPRRRGIVVHRSKDLAHAAPSSRRRIPVTNPLRTLADLGAVAPLCAVRNAVHVAVASRLVTYPALDAELMRLAKRGRRGVGPLRAVLDERLDATRSPSVLESRMDRVLLRADVPRPAVEIKNGPDGEYRCDYTWEEIKLILEAKGFMAHGSVAAASADIERELAITVAHGYQIVTIDWNQVVRSPDRLAFRVNRIYWTRAALFGIRPPSRAGSTDAS